MRMHFRLNKLLLGNELEQTDSTSDEPELEQTDSISENNCTGIIIPGRKLSSVEVLLNKSELVEI